ncbi:MAG: hypothetical protein WBE34_01535 [Candidatus Nitrosopolaris sp.]
MITRSYRKPNNVGLSFYHMVELRKYFDKFQDKIGETYSPDKILEEPWCRVVVRELNLMSFYCARELQLETGKPYSKYYTDGKHAYDLAYEESPPTRLLALNIILSYWLGWLDASKSHHLDTEPIFAWKRIEEAYNKGKVAYK